MPFAGPPPQPADTGCMKMIGASTPSPKVTISHAVWSASSARNSLLLRACPDLYPLLLKARQNGEQHLEQIASDHAPGYGWPTDLATRCLTSEVRFDFTEAHREGLEEFLEMSAEFGLCEPPGKLHYYQP